MGSLVWRRALVFASLLPFFFLAGCGDGDADGNVTGSPNEAPTAVIAEPSDGATFQEGVEITFVGSAADQEDGTLTGNAVQWSSDVDGDLGTGQTVSTTLSVGTHTITLTATDSDGATDEATIQVTVEANSAPTATITSPSDGATFTKDVEITFEGSADDPEDGALTGAALQWSSDVDGDLGTGQTVSTTLSVGTHTITLTATDSDGATDEATIQVTVEANSAPTATITSPSDGATFQEGTEITFEGSADDPEDGALTGAALQWSSDVDGVLGTGQTGSTTLSVGTHTITLTATDSDGATDEATIQVTVESTTSSNERITVKTDRDGNSEVYLINPDGTNPTRLTNDPAEDVGGACSPDGTEIGFTSDRDGSDDIFVMNADGSNVRQLTQTASITQGGDWSPNGAKIVFESDRFGTDDVFVMDADGSNVMQLTDDLSPIGDHPGDWNPNDRILFTSGRDGGIYLDLWTMNPDGSGKTQLTENSVHEITGRWSPDGSRIAFSADADEDGDLDVLVMDADGTNRTQLTNSQAYDIVGPWSPDGTQIAFTRFGSVDQATGDIFVMNADGSNASQITDTGGVLTAAVDWCSLQTP